MTNAWLLSLLLIIAACPARAQHALFLSQGKIEFERKVNQYAQMESVMDPGDEAWTEFRKKLSGNQFKTDYFDLLFTRSKTLYRPGREGSYSPTQFFFQPPAQDNIVYSDLEDQKSIAQKKAFGEVFLVQDTLRRIKWKITDETRTIAGFACRRANAVIMDSIYVVAFYTDEILTSGGPESFTGLPGMILGIAMPHEHVSWFATKVEAISIPDAQVAGPAKGKKINNAGLLQTIKGSLKDWGKEGQQFMRALML